MGPTSPKDDAFKLKPTLFIASSSEGKSYASGIFSEMEDFCEPTIWSQNLFTPTKGLLEELIKKIPNFDFAVVVLTPDDQRFCRSKESSVPRDNVIFELGLSLGSLGRDRVFFLVPDDAEMSIPSDMFGVTALTYQIRNDDKKEAAVHTACNTIKRVINNLSSNNPVGGKLWSSIAIREASGVSPKQLISESRSYILFSGLSLSFLIRYCSNEIRTALQRNVSVEFVLVNRSEEAKRIYEPYTPYLDEDIIQRYRDFFHGLTPKLQERIGIFRTDLFLTHTLGFYDDVFFVNEICFAGNDTTSVPTISCSLSDIWYSRFCDEASFLLKKSELHFGKSQTAYRTL